MDWLKDNYTELLLNPFVRAGIVIIGSIIIAKITDWIFVGILNGGHPRLKRASMIVWLIFYTNPSFIQFYFLVFQLASTF